MKMKKMMLLMLTLLIWSTASVNAQVTIGSSSDPHPSAILDLESTTQGLKLPTVVLTNRTTFLDKGGDKTAAKGMLVYNTSSSFEGPGLYVWSGTSWIAVSTISCTTPAVPVRLTFSPAFNGGNIVQNTLITATAPLTEGATSYTWSVPAGLEITGDATGRIVTIRAINQGTYNASDITVKAINECFSSEPRTGTGTTINVTACTAGVGPAMPTLTIPIVRLDIGATVTISCGDVGATEYHWTFPSGIEPASATTAVNSIEVVVKDEGYYYANDFSVYAKTGCGESGVRTGTAGALIVEEATQAPSDPYFSPLSGTIASGSRFSIRVSVATKGVTTYEWSLPAGLSIVSESNANIITVEATKVGVVTGSDIKVKVTNAKGSLEIKGSGTVTVIAPGAPSTNAVGAHFTYTTFKYPLGLGTWMTENSKEEPATFTEYDAEHGGARGYYYNINASKTACPMDYQLPTPEQFDALWSYLKTKTGITPETAPWISSDALAGSRTANTPSNWGISGTYRTDVSSSNLYYTANVNGTYSTGTPSNNGYSVRCVKSICDEAPYVSLSFLGKDIPIGLPVRIWATTASSSTYQWLIPAGATLISQTNTADTLVIQFNNPVGFDGSQLSVKVENACGSTTLSYEGTFKVTEDLGHAGDKLTGATGTEYNTYVYPANIGTWMEDWSREGNPRYKTYEGHGEGERGFYYLPDELSLPCPTGWRLPNLQEITKLTSYWRNLKTTGTPNPSFYSALPGAIQAGSTLYWDLRGYLLADRGYGRYVQDEQAHSLEVDGFVGSSAMTARCLKIE